MTKRQILDRLMSGEGKALALPVLVAVVEGGSDECLKIVERALHAVDADRQRTQH